MKLLVRDIMLQYSVDLPLSLILVTADCTTTSHQNEKDNPARKKENKVGLSFHGEKKQTGKVHKDCCCC